MTKLEIFIGVAIWVAIWAIAIIFTAFIIRLDSNSKYRSELYEASDNPCAIEKVYFLEIIFPARLLACGVVWDVAESKIGRVNDCKK